MRFMALLIGITIVFVSLSLENVYAKREGLVLWLSFQGTRDVERDLSGNRNDGEIVGGAKRVPGKYGDGISIGIKDEYVEIPGVITPEGTMEFWFKPNWDGSDPETYRLFDATVGELYFLIGKGESTIEDTANLGVWMEDLPDVGFSAWFPAADAIPSAGEWYHVAATWEFDGGLPKFYLNGEETANSWGELAALGGFPDLNPNPRIGFNSNPNYRAAHNGADAVIDEFAIYSRVLDADEIKRDMVALSGAVEPRDKLPAMWGEIKSE